MSLDSQKHLRPPPNEIIDKNNSDLAQATAIFYPEAINIILSAGSPAEKDQQFLSIAESLPPHLKPLYLKGFALFKSEAEKNRLQYKKEDNVGRTLYNHLLQRQLAKGLSDCEPLLKPQEDGKIIRVAEIYPGIPTLFLRDDIFKAFRPTAAACYFFGDNLSISFICAPGSLQNELGNLKTFRHEVHHAVWNLLGKSGFIRPSSETDPETKDSFNSTRDELAAYLLGERTDAPISGTCYSKNPEIIKKTEIARNSLYIVAISLYQQKIDRKTLLYGIMKSQNYNELITNLRSELPVPQNPLSSENLSYFFKQWWELQFNGPDFQHTFTDILRQKKVAITPEIARGFIIAEIIKRKPKTPDQVIQYFEHPVGCKKFLSGLTGENSIALSPSTISEIIKESQKSS